MTLDYDQPLSNFAFKIKLRRYHEAFAALPMDKQQQMASAFVAGFRV